VFCPRLTESKEVLITRNSVTEARGQPKNGSVFLWFPASLAVSQAAILVVKVVISKGSIDYLYAVELI